ncbi:hypothetical protein Tco_0444892 [Tanacetum coccineum]
MLQSISKYTQTPPNLFKLLVDTSIHWKACSFEGVRCKTEGDMWTIVPCYRRKASFKSLIIVPSTGYLACARCASTGAIVLIHPVTSANSISQPSTPPKTERCSKGSSAGKVAKNKRSILDYSVAI